MFFSNLSTNNDINSILLKMLIYNKMKALLCYEGPVKS